MPPAGPDAAAAGLGGPWALALAAAADARAPACGGGEAGGRVPGAARVHWRVRRNVAAWARAAKAAQPDWVGLPPMGRAPRGFFVRENAATVAALPFLPETGVHDKVACFRYLVEDAPADVRERVAPYLPETFFTHEAFERAASGPAPAMTPEWEHAAAAGARAEGRNPADREALGVDDVFFWKSAASDNGNGVVAFRASTASEAASVAKLLRRHRKARGKTRDFGGQELPKGIYQRFVPRLLLWDRGASAPGHKFDLRVFVAGLSHGGAVRAFVYRDAAVRVSRSAFDPASMGADVQMTHRSLIVPTSGPTAGGDAWPAWGAHVFPCVVAATGALVEALRPKLVRSEGLFLYGFDYCVDAAYRVRLLEVNTSPQLLYPRRAYAAWVGVVHAMLSALLTDVVAPFLRGSPASLPGGSRWVRCL